MNTIGHFGKELRSGVLAAAVLALTACSLLPGRKTLAPPPLLTPASLGSTVGALQAVHAAFAAREVSFQCVVDVDPQHLTLIGLSAQGQRWFSLRYDGSTLASESAPQAPEGLDPQRVLADLQLALWPLAALQQATAGTAWQVSQPVPATRRLRRDGQLVAEVHYAGADPWRGRLWLSNFDAGYSLAVESGPLQ